MVSSKELDQATAFGERVSASLCAQQAFTAVFQVCTATHSTDSATERTIKCNLKIHACSMKQLLSLRNSVQRFIIATKYLFQLLQPSSQALLQVESLLPLDEVEITLAAASERGATALLRVKDVSGLGSLLQACRVRRGGSRRRRKRQRRRKSLSRPHRLQRWWRQGRSSGCCRTSSSALTRLSTPCASALLPLKCATRPSISQLPCSPVPLCAWSMHSDSKDVIPCMRLR